MISVENVILENKPLSNFELIDSIKKLKIKHFRGVFLRDQLPSKPRKNECGIINLADSDDSRGTHWVCYYRKNNKNYYFDSYGLRYPLELERYLDDNIEYSKIQIQKNGVICGHLCLYVLSKLSKGIELNDIIHNLLP